MTPELPRAPINEPWAIAVHTSSMAVASPTSAHTDSSVSAMFVPVSPSGHRVHVEAVQLLLMVAERLAVRADDPRQRRTVELGEIPHVATDRSGGGAIGLRVRHGAAASGENRSPLLPCTSYVEDPAPRLLDDPIPCEGIRNHGAGL